MALHMLRFCFPNTEKQCIKAFFFLSLHIQLLLQLLYCFDLNSWVFSLSNFSSYRGGRVVNEQVSGFQSLARLNPLHKLYDFHLSQRNSDTGLQFNPGFVSINNIKQQQLPLYKLSKTLAGVSQSQHFCDWFLAKLSNSVRLSWVNFCWMVSLMHTMQICSASAVAT